MTMRELERWLLLEVAGKYHHKKPVQLVTARIILLAGLSNFLADPKASFRRVQDAADNRVSTFLERWINALQPHVRSSLS